VALRSPLAALLALCLCGGCQARSDESGIVVASSARNQGGQPVFWTAREVTLQPVTAAVRAVAFAALLGCSAEDSLPDHRIDREERLDKFSRVSHASRGDRYGSTSRHVTLRTSDSKCLDGRRARGAFGDGWEHDAVVERAVDNGATEIVCLGGARACRVPSAFLIHWSWCGSARARSPFARLA
jgi:hypothetical protein